jgi:hypothetical protein
MDNEPCQACEWLEISYEIRWSGYEIWRNVVGWFEELLRVEVFFRQFSFLYVLISVKFPSKYRNDFLRRIPLYGTIGIC